MSVKWSGRGDGGSSAFSAAPFSVMSPTIQHSDKSPNLIKALSSDGLRTDFRLSGKAIISEPINYQCKFERCCARMIAFLLMIEVPRPIRSRRWSSTLCANWSRSRSASALTARALSAGADSCPRWRDCAPVGAGYQPRFRRKETAPIWAIDRGRYRGARLGGLNSPHRSYTGYCCSYDGAPMA